MMVVTPGTRVPSLSLYRLVGNGDRSCVLDANDNGRCVVDLAEVNLRPCFSLSHVGGSYIELDGLLVLVVTLTDSDSVQVHARFLTDRASALLGPKRV